MKKLLAFSVWLSVLGTSTAVAQRLLTLDSCRAMALRNNKQLSVSKVKQDIAANLRKSARTKYLPHVSALGTYMHTTESVQLMNSADQQLLSNLGTVTTHSEGFTSAMGALGNLSGALGQMAPTLSALGFDLTQLEGVSNLVKTSPEALEGKLNAIGQHVVDAFDTDTRNLWAGSIMLTQPVFLGGSIVALNRLADINEELARNGIDAKEQAIVYATDKAYWQVVSLRHKQRLAQASVLARQLQQQLQRPSPSVISFF